MSISVVWRVVFAVLVLATVYLSLVPVEQVPSSLQFWDKAQHALGFAGLAVVGLQAFSEFRWRLLGGLMLLGVAIECVQAWTGWRQGDVLDALADALGLVVGGAVWYAADRLGWTTGGRMSRSST